MTIMGRVLRIERSSNKDGSGIRTVVFLKGCPLRCQWCSTPESQSLQYEVGILRSRCILCGKCAELCPEKIIRCDADAGVSVKGTGCTGCGRCRNACGQNAVKIYGQDMSSDEVIDEITKDDVFFLYGGGVTISGGEPLYQPKFTTDILRKSFELGIDRTIETSCYAAWELIMPMLDYLPTMFIDIKIMDPETHKRYTGIDNSLILENIKRIDQLGKTKITVRVPFVPSVNDSISNFEQMAGFIMGLKNISAIEILPYHRLGVETYKNLGREVPFPEISPPSKQDISVKIQPLNELKNTVIKITN